MAPLTNYDSDGNTKKKLKQSCNFYFLDENQEICVVMISSLFGLGVKAMLAGILGISGIGNSKFLKTSSSVPNINF